MECPICKQREYLVRSVEGVVCCRICDGVSKYSGEVSLVRLNDLPYKLNRIQERISDGLQKSNAKTILIEAICGAGKTEMVFKKIKMCLNAGKTVGFITPRKEVTKELFNRFKNLSENEIGLWCDRSNNKIYTQLVFLTSHQLSHFIKYFELIIFDEVDAFPYHNNYLLNLKLLNSKKNLSSTIIYLSATPSKKLRRQVEEVFYAYGRYHLYPHPNVNKSYQFNGRVMRFIQTYPNTLIYVPTKKMGNKLSKKLSIPFYCSDTEENYLKQFQNNKINTLITTIILERGITIESVNVIVLNSEHGVFLEESLIQIAGRVGRKEAAPDGQILFFYKSKTRKLNRVIKKIRQYNLNLQEEIKV
jgi:competence protein ComFA